jgi:triosephosphate isomerase
VSAPPLGRRPLVAGNWKMNKTAAEARTLVEELLARPLSAAVDVVVAPPFTALWAAHGALRGSQVALAAQTMHEGEHGAFTGEVSGPMLREAGATYVILGHSERRLINNESDESVNLKVHAALTHGLIPIIAVGESAAEHASGETLAKVLTQTRIAFDGVAPADAARCVVAYEPIWAIGTGLVEDPESADAVIGEIRNAVPGLANARMLYGGSMKPDNAVALLECPNIDGGLVGGASLNAKSFAAIVDAAALRVAR